MTDDLANYYEELQEVNQKAHADVEINFSNLAAAAHKLDPIKLLSQLTLTFLCVPKNQFVEESSDLFTWQRYIEFLAGYLLSSKYPPNNKQEVDGKDLENIEKLLDEYFRSISLYLTTYSPADEKDKDIEMVIASAKIHSLCVRGEAYPHQLRETAQSLYSQHDDWFAKNLGFTINDALSISNSIINEYNRRINDEKHSRLGRVQAFVNALINNGEEKEENRKELEDGISYYYYFGNSDSILSFTLDDLIRFSGFSKEICDHYLERLSQAFGYKNTNFPNVFSDPHAAPWDYNSLYERPIVSYNGKYFVPIPSLFSEVLLHTFYYDLIADNGYWTGKGETKYGIWLEQRSAAFFKRIFPESEVFLNPHYPNREELCDVLILHDRKVFIVQCKTKKLRRDSRIGKDFHAIKKDLTKGIKESFDQAIRARDYFLKNPSPKIIVPDGEFVIDSRQISDIFPMSVTLDGYQNLTTRLANINPTLHLFANNEYPWAISLFHLGVVTELIEYPSMFIHYARRRSEVERTNFQLRADEIDLLGFYFSHGLFFETEDFEQIDGAGLSGFSDEIDQYIFEKYACGKNPQKPKQEMPAKFSEYLHTIENMESSYKTDCAIRLLDLGYQGRERFVSAVEQAKAEIINNSSLQSFSTVINSKRLGFSFVSMDTNGDLEKLFDQTFLFAALKKYATKCKEWVGFGWDKNSKNLLDVSVFLSFDWQEDPELAKLTEKNLKQGQMIIA